MTLSEKRFLQSNQFAAMRDEKLRVTAGKCEECQSAEDVQVFVSSGLKLFALCGTHFSRARSADDRVVNISRRQRLPSWVKKNRKLARKEANRDAARSATNLKNAGNPGVRSQG